MSGALRVVGAALVTCGLYAAFVLEAAVHAPSIAPHLPLAFAVWGLFSLSTGRALFAAALIGLGCDALSAGPLGPGMLAATVVCFVAKPIQMRRDNRSVMATGVVTAIVVAAILVLAAAISESVLGARIDLRVTALVAGCRGMTTAAMVVALVLAVRSMRLVQRVATAI